MDHYTDYTWHDHMTVKITDNSYDVSHFQATLSKHGADEFATCWGKCNSKINEALTNCATSELIRTESEGDKTSSSPKSRSEWSESPCEWSSGRRMFRSRTKRFRSIEHYIVNIHLSSV